MDIHFAVPKPVHFIDSLKQLTACLQALQAGPVIAFDLEFDNNLRAYGITLCLIQVATPAACYIIDPLAGLDLRGLYAVFEDGQVEKIVHSPGEDLRLLHSLGCYPKNLFDTQLAAVLLNDEHTSLAAQLQQRLGYTMSKGQQRSDWRRRPLDPAQISYAAADVAWLHDLKDVLVKEAQSKGMIAFVQDEQAALSTTIYRAEAKTSFLKAADGHSLSPRDQYVLNELLALRDGIARKLNKPAFQVMEEPLVRELAAGTVLPEELPDKKGVHHSLKNDRFVAELEARLKAAAAEAQTRNLSASLPARKLLSRAEQQEKEQANKDRGRKFAPIQEALSAQFGINAARYILSNGAVNDLLLKTTRISGLKPYRQQLIRGIAASLSIDLTEYE